MYYVLDNTQNEHLLEMWTLDIHSLSIKNMFVTKLNFETTIIIM